MGCVTTPSFSILINGKPYGNVHPTRGIHQGDHLSVPYLFLLCAEGFTSLLAKAKMERHIKGVSICRRAPKISIVMFADDSLFFCQATQTEVVVVNVVLQTYANASGQCINMEKSSVFFNSNTPIGQKSGDCVSPRCEGGGAIESYLGLPTLVGRTKYQTFSFLKDQVWKKLQGWKDKLFSKAGKEVLIQAVAQSIPTYAMGVFQLPLKLCDELNALCAKFWWGQLGDERKVHWRSWDNLSQPKNDGGMRFWDLRSFNLAMLAKQGWRLLHNHDSLLFKCFKARYFPRCHFLEAMDSPNSSYVWQSMVAALPILKSGCCWRVGNGVSIKVHKDKWIPNYPANKILLPAQEESKKWLMSELIDSVSHCRRCDVI